MITKSKKEHCENKRSWSGERGHTMAVVWNPVSSSQYSSLRHIFYEIITYLQYTGIDNRHGKQKLSPCESFLSVFFICFLSYFYACFFSNFFLVGFWECVQIQITEKNYIVINNIIFFSLWECVKIRITILIFFSLWECGEGLSRRQLCLPLTPSSQGLSLYSI